MAGILPQLGISSSNPNLAGLSSTIAINPSGGLTTPSSAAAAGVSNGIRAANPSQNVTQPSNTISSSYAATPTASSSLGSYKGTPIYAGNQASIQSQMAAIDAGQGGTNTTGSAGGGQIGNTNNNLTALPQAPTGYQSSATIPGNDPTYSSTTGSTSSDSTQPNNGQATTGNYTAYNTATGAPTVYGTGSPGTTAPATNAGILNQLLGASTNNSAEQNAQNALQNFETQVAQQNADISGGDQPLYFKQGEQGQLQQAAQVKQAALTQAVQNAIQEQQTQVTGLSNAATATLPGQQNYQVAPGSTAYNAQNQQVAGGLGGYANYSTAQQVYSLSGQYPDAVNSQGQTFTYDPSQTPQQNVQNFDQNYLPNSPTYQKATYGQPGTNSVAAATELGTSASGYAQAAQQSNANVAAYSAANQQGQTVAQLLSSTGLDSAASPYYNQAINTLGAKLGSTNVAALTTAISELSTMYTNLLGTTGSNTPSGNEAIASSIAALNPNSSAKVIAASLGQLQTAAYAKISAQYNLAQQYAQSLGQGGSSNAGNSNSTNTGTFSDGSFFGTSG